MYIGPALPQDAPVIAQHILLAMEEIAYQFIGERDYDKAYEFIYSLVMQGQNQYSFENCLVIKENDIVVATAVIYDGALLHTLRQPVAQIVEKIFQKDFNPEDETQAGEFYIDCIGVDSNYQGKGLGSKMLQYLIQEFAHHRKQNLGLLVDKNNPQAKKLYLKLGFQIVGEKTLTGKLMEHLQYSPQ